MLSKLKGLLIPKKSLPNLGDLQDKLSNGLFEVVEVAFAQRQSDAKNSTYTIADVETIIKEYSDKNSKLAMLSSIVPGPFGVLTSIPEVLLNFNNQMNMIYDLGCAYGKENFINKDVLLEIPLAAFGGKTNLAQLQNSPTDLIDSQVNALKEKAQTLGKGVIEKAVKNSIIQFIPGAGPIFMTTWAKANTVKISKYAILFLDSKETYVEPQVKEVTEETMLLIQTEKIKAMINLIESNNEINATQVSYLKPIIENSDLSTIDKEFYLEQAAKEGSNLSLNYQLIKDYTEAENLMIELVVLAKRDGDMDELEKAYIHKVGQELGLEHTFIDELL